MRKHVNIFFHWFQALLLSIPDKTIRCCHSDHHPSILCLVSKASIKAKISMKAVFEEHEARVEGLLMIQNNSQPFFFFFFSSFFLSLSLQIWQIITLLKIPKIPQNIYMKILHYQRRFYNLTLTSELWNVSNGPERTEHHYCSRLPSSPQSIVLARQTKETTRNDHLWVSSRRPRFA